MIDILIIGAGTAGLSAAIYGCRSGNEVLVLERKVYGGQIVNTHDIENYPAIPLISGFDYSMSIYNQAVNLGAKVEFSEMTDFDFSSKEKIIKIGDKEIKSKTVIIANGVENRKLGCIGEEEFNAKGVSYCATCDGAFYKNKDVCIVGGGNTAIEDALFLANNCNTVYLIHRRDAFRAHKKAVDAVLKNPKIKILYDSEVKLINGDDKVTSVDVYNKKTEQIQTLDVSGIFVAVGQVPQNQIFKDVINLDENGYIIANEECKTNVEGVFVAGDTRTKNVRQLVTAASDGAIASIAASNYISLNF